MVLNCLLGVLCLPLLALHCIFWEEGLLLLLRGRLQHMRWLSPSLKPV